MRIGFEDLNGGGDLSFNDAILEVSGADVFEPLPPDTGDPLVDHFKCYKTKVISAEAPQITVRVLDQFSQEKDLDLKKPIRFCESADKNGEGRTDPNAKLVCYKAVPRKGQPKHVKVTGLFINNQFGPDELDTVKESEFCIPAFDIPPPG